MLIAELADTSDYLQMESILIGFFWRRGENNANRFIFRSVAVWLKIWFLA